LTVANSRPCSSNDVRAAAKSTVAKGEGGNAARGDGSTVGLWVGNAGGVAVFVAVGVNWEEPITGAKISFVVELADRVVSIGVVAAGGVVLGAGYAPPGPTGVIEESPEG